MNIEDSRKIRLVDFLKVHGHTPVKVRGTSYWYLSPLRSEAEPSFKVNDRLNKWYDYALATGGDLVELGKYLYKTNDVSMVLRCLAQNAAIANLCGTPHRSYCEADDMPMKDVEIKPLTHSALITYARSRDIDVEAITHLCEEIHYTVGKKRFFGIAFRNDSGGYEVRNAYFKGCYKGKDITTVYLPNGVAIKHVCVFEGFMDFLSYMTLMMKGDTTTCITHASDFIIMNSVANLRKTLVKLEQYQHAHCYLDNDIAGSKTFETIKGILGERAINESLRYAQYKDLNDFIRDKKQ